MTNVYKLVSKKGGQPRSICEMISGRLLQAVWWCQVRWGQSLLISKGLVDLHIGWCRDVQPMCWPPIAITGNWRLCLHDTSPTGHFAYETFHLRDTSPTGHFNYWTVRPLSGHFAYLLFNKCKVVNYDFKMQ